MAMAQSAFTRPALAAAFSVPGQRVSVRPATATDLSALTYALEALAAYEGLSSEVHARPSDLALALFGPVPKAHAFVAETLATETQKPLIVGVALYMFRYSGFWGDCKLYLDAIYVDPEARGLGVGKKLFTALAQTALQQGCSDVHWRVLDWNKPTIAFYQNLGARQQAEWQYYELKGAALEAVAQTVSLK